MFAEGFDGLETVPSAFVLMGNFQSQPATTASTDYTVIREQFKSLAIVISRYQRLQVGHALHFTSCGCLWPSASCIMLASAASPACLWQNIQELHSTVPWSISSSINAVCTILLGSGQE